MITHPFRRSSRLPALRFSRSLVLHSGGQDSTTCLALAARCSSEVFTVGVDYGQRHVNELLAAGRCAAALGVDARHVVSLRCPALEEVGDSALLATSYRAWAGRHARSPELPATFVPGRNSVLLSLAAAVAYKVGAEAIWIGTSQTDYSGYPDCREAWLLAKEEELSLGVGSGRCDTLGIPSGQLGTRWPQLVAPLLYKTKAQTFALAEAMGVDSVISSETVTCYRGEVDRRLDPREAGRGCNACDACALRLRGWLEYTGRQPELLDEARRWLSGAEAPGPVQLSPAEEAEAALAELRAGGAPETVVNSLLLTSPGSSAALANLVRQLAMQAHLVRQPLDGEG